MFDGLKTKLGGVSDQAPQPTGNISKGKRALFVFCLATVVIVVAALSSRNEKPAFKTPPQNIAALTGQDSTDPSATISQLQSQLLSEQATLRRQNQELALQAGNAQAQVVNPVGSQYPQMAPQQDQVRDAIRATDAMRDFMSPVVEDYIGSDQGDAAPKQSVQYPQAETPKPAAPAPALERPDVLDKAYGKEHVLFEGTIIDTVLVNRLDGDFSGPVKCMVAEDVYSHDGKELLVPAGTIVLGMAKKVGDRDQSRLAVSFHRMIMPDGYSVSLDKFQGLNQEGDAALKDKVNHHYATLFGASIAVGLLGGLSEEGTGSALTANGFGYYRQGVATEAGNEGTQILSRMLNRFPDITIREGHRVKIYISNDLVLPVYSHHQMDPDL